MTELSHRDRAALVGLADGTLTGAARARAEARVRALPDADRLIERQRRVTRALGIGLDPLPAPARAPATASAAPRLALAGALATVLLVLGLLLPQGGDSTVEQAADRAQLPATAPAPAASGPVLQAAVEGVRFPAWGEQFGWHETGMRRDELEGRDSTTVFYEHQGHRIAYTIVSGPALPRPEDARVIRREGLEIAVYRDPSHGGHDVAVFERDGRTCVLAGHVMRLSTLIELAAWTGDGRLRS
jgi:hypothetical protein